MAKYFQSDNLDRIFFIQVHNEDLLWRVNGGIRCREVFQEAQCKGYNSFVPSMVSGPERMWRHRLRMEQILYR
ncbi:hypothetical protein GT93_08120 [Pseudomonas plecoglossicida]|nr:hypothetical protein GT93_08120 [Pseudomonas plecoglossicida]